MGRVNKKAKEIQREKDARKRVREIERKGDQRLAILYVVHCTSTEHIIVNKQYRSTYNYHQLVIQASD